MKKILFFLLLLFCIPFSSFGISGDGSFGTPYSGPLTTDMTWSGTVYVNGDVTVNGFTLTISPGTIIVFLASGSDIIITGTGILTASGSAVSMIRFTADFNNNGIYGESGETWGHISFQNMTPGFTTPSLINYCIVEYGQKNPSPLNVESEGGGIQTTYTYLTISNSIIRNNYAGFGGGIFVYSNASPSIKNCLVTNNTAETTGGGILISGCPSTIVENCIISKNTSLGIGGGGGVFIGVSTNVRVYNCTIVSNISSINYGNNIRLYENFGTDRPKFFNSIVWGSDNSIYYLWYQNPIAGDFNNCAIQGYTSGYTNCVNLSATNSDITGPNFYNVTSGSEDYRINFISPCRDAGTTPGPTVPNDYIGNPRIGPYDIGAYEVQYSRWTGGTDVWETGSNWEQGILPVTTVSDVIIPKTGVTTLPVNASNPSYEIGSGKFLIIDSGAHLTLATLTNTLGTLRAYYNLNNLASLKIGNYVDNVGKEELSLYLRGNNSTMWHYISPPVASLATSVFYYSGSGAAVAEYRENLINNDMNNGWVTSTGYHYNSAALPPAWEPGSTIWSNLLVGSGYNYFGNSSKTFTIQGAINTGDVFVNLVYNSGSFTPANTVQRGYNLIGNPYTCGLNWDAVVSDVYNTGQAEWSNVEQAIYFRKNGMTYYYVGGLTVPSDQAGNPIAPMQGFFIHSKTNFTLKIPEATSKVHTLNTRFKGSTIIPSVRLQLESSGKTDETLIRFDEKATLTFDNSFDARKFSTESGVLSISSLLEGTEYAINGIPFPENSTSVPLIINANTTGSYTIKATEILGIDNYKVYLNDKLQNTTVNLSDINSYSFDATKGLTIDRFTITISNVVTAIPETSFNNKLFNIYSSGEQINIQTLSDDWSGKQGNIKVLDITGRVISLLDKVEFSKDEIHQIPVRAGSGIYIVEIRSGVMKYVGKVVIR